MTKRVAKKSAKPTKKKRTTRGTVRRPRVSSASLMHLLNEPGDEAFDAALVASKVKSVVFTCSNPACLVRITTDAFNVGFAGSAALSFPVGRTRLSFLILGPRRSVTLTTQGATLNPPVAGTPKFGGMTFLTVAP